MPFLIRIKRKDFRSLANDKIYKYGHNFGRMVNT